MEADCPSFGMEAEGPSFSASDSNGSDGGKYRGEELGCSSISPAAASDGKASSLFCGCVVCGCFVGVCEVVSGRTVAESHVIALGMMGRMAVVCVHDGGSFSRGLR